MSDLMVNVLRTLNSILTAGIAITAFSLLLYVLSFNLRDRVTRSLAIILSCVVVVFIGEALSSVASTPEGLEFILRLQWVGIAFLPAAYMHFSVALLATTGLPSRGRRRLAVRLGYQISLGFLILLPTLLIAKQPDLGTAFLVASSGPAVLFFAGLSYWFIIAIAGIIGASTPIIWHFMHDYQRDRVRTFLNPEADPLGGGYHIIQSKIAIGSGGIYAKGWLGSTQSELGFLPESSTDFIFAVFAEEFGLFGCIGLLTLYLLIIGRSLYIASQARDSFNRLLASSLAFTFFVYVFV